MKELYHDYLYPESADPNTSGIYNGAFFFNVKNIAGFECARCKFVSNKYSKKIKNGEISRVI